ncbi:hypothetical protein [Ralstonia mannitolilytica]|uniref:hypothetical protein n=1 Tax=Ralstonia mannitolilytica TaxID=105219 RepID=UPI00374A4262
MQNRQQQLIVSATQEALRRDPTLTGDALQEEVQDILCDWAAEDAHEREINGEPEDTPCVAHCDDWGTGEGRYHGRI